MTDPKSKSAIWIRLEPGGETVPVILLTDATLIATWRGEVRPFRHRAGDTVQLGASQAARLVRRGTARWPGRPAEPEHAA